MITGRTRVFGLVGHPVRHSLSPAMHNELFRRERIDAIYVALDVPPARAASVADAIRTLALAGVKRTELFDPALMQPIDPDHLLPAPGQGALALQCRRSDARTMKLLAALDDEPSAACVAAERKLVRALEGDCHSPIAAMATSESGVLTLRAAIGRNHPEVVPARERHVLRVRRDVHVPERRRRAREAPLRIGREVDPHQVSVDDRAERPAVGGPEQVRHAAPADPLGAGLRVPLDQRGEGPEIEELPLLPALRVQNSQSARGSHPQHSAGVAINRLIGRRAQHSRLAPSPSRELLSFGIELPQPGSVCHPDFSVSI
jgi:hypothetical protein